MPRPQLELKGFQRVHIDAGAEKEVTLELKAHDLAFWDIAAHEWRVEKEQVRVLAGAFMDSAGLFNGLADHDRVSILLDMLGRKVRVLLDAEMVAAA